MVNKTSKTKRRAAKAQNTKKVATKNKKKRRTVIHSDPYLHCLTGPVEMANTQSGYPDGDGKSSVVLEYRRAYSVLPVNGTIQLVIAPNASGCLGVVTGRTASPIVNQLASTTSGFTNTSINNTVDAPGMIPENFLSTVTNALPYPTLNRSSPSFRPTVCTANFTYTGSSMMDNGSVVVSKLVNSEAIGGSLSIDASTDYNVDNAVFSPLTEGLLPSSYVGAARHGFNVRAAPVRPLYETTEASGVSLAATTNYPYRTRTADTLGFGIAPSYHSQCPWYLITYSGLDASASINVSYRYCVQYTVTAASSVSPFAAPSPVASPGILEKAARYISSLPVVTPIANSLLAAGYNMAAQYVNRRYPMLMSH